MLLKKNQKLALTLVLFVLLSAIFTQSISILLNLLKNLNMQNINWIDSIDYKSIEMRKGVVYSMTFLIFILIYIFMHYKIVTKDIQVKTRIITTSIHIVAVVNLLREYIYFEYEVETLFKYLTYLSALVIPLYFFYILKILETFNESLTKEQIQSNLLEKLSYTDKLTSLPNRAYIFHKIQNKIVNNSLKFGILFLDLDGFKEVNDTFGHDVGDDVLIEIGIRLIKCVRPNDVVARLGGDEFLVVVSDIEDDYILEDISKKIIYEVNQKIYVDDHKIKVGTSIGISIYPEHGKNTDDLIKCADIALYEVKKESKNNYKFYSKSYSNPQSPRY